ncbi:MAG: SRPBCC family protein [Candidatus Dormibacteria bacterium]
MTACEHVRVTSSIPVSLPPDEAFTLFTASGERSWVDGWDPQFPSPPADETEPGTVFTTAHGPHGTTWVVVRREGRRLVAYSNVTPGERAALITVSLEPSAAGTTATVRYEITALAPEANPAVREFGAHYVEYLDGWRDRITRRGVPALRNRHP